MERMGAGLPTWVVDQLGNNSNWHLLKTEGEVEEAYPTKISLRMALVLRIVDIDVAAEVHLACMEVVLMLGSRVGLVAVRIDEVAFHILESDCHSNRREAVVACLRTYCLNCKLLPDDLHTSFAMDHRALAMLHIKEELAAKNLEAEADFCSHYHRELFSTQHN